MAKLTASKRAKLPSSTFAGPSRSFPIPDKAHAKAALMLEKNAPPSARPRIESKAKAMLKRGGGGMTEKQDARYDRAHSIKENSARDKRQDKKMDVKMGGGGMKVTSARSISGVPKAKPANAFPAARPTGSKSPTGGAKPATRGPSKGPSGRAVQGPTRGGGGSRRGRY